MEGSRIFKLEKSTQDFSSFIKEDASTGAGEEHIK